MAWFDAWYPKPDDEFCIIIEDDIEMSPFWFTWLKKAWANYKDRDDIFGIALQVLLAINFLGTWDFNSSGCWFESCPGPGLL